MPAVYEALRKAVEIKFAGRGFCLRAARPESGGAALKLESLSVGEVDSIALFIDSASAEDSRRSYDVLDSGDAWLCVSAGVDAFMFSYMSFPCAVDDQVVVESAGVGWPDDDEKSIMS
jgi:hypothetical protein